jgi:hypothetical protein
MQPNRGYYYHLGWLTKMYATRADLVALTHNDLIFQEHGWDRRLRETFLANGDLGLVGVCGSNEVDDRGGRGGGTMCNFQGTHPLGQLCEHTGRRVTDLNPALILDSMFMCFRAAAIPDLGVIDENIPLCHFVDKVWPLRLVQKGWKVGVLGLGVDHLGGQTSVASQRYASKDAQRWCQEQGIEPEANGDISLYLESERRFKDEMHQFIPARMDGWRAVPC